MSDETLILICCVCSEEVDDSNSSDCHGCGRRYHLNQRNDVPGKDCGDVWINDVSLGLEFGCQTCIETVFAQPPMPAEAHGAAGIDPSQMAALYGMPFPPGMPGMPAAFGAPAEAATPAQGSAEPRKRRYRRRE